MTTTTTVSKFELWLQAIEQLSEAFDAIDQAHASMRDARLDEVGIVQLAKSAESQLAELRALYCDECGHPLTAHCGAHGCEQERGDISIWGVETAGGPCSCREYN